MFSLFTHKKKDDIFLFNTKTKQKEKLETLRKNTVSLYTCGPTVYNYAHLGNLRSYVFADVLKRTLTYFNYNVKHVINITDVGHLVSDADEGEDKLEKGAQREGKSAQEIANFYTDAFLNDLTLLNIQKDDTQFPKATDYIQEQISLIQTLEKKGLTYTTSDGVYFDTAQFPQYGALGGVDLKGLKEGARVEANTEKENPTDFALWKLSKSGEQRQQEWESPWGVGFPGWHIECSAMAMKLLGEQIDIHTGGIDHIPVHHNNEIAQSESATGREFARVWMHNQFVNISGGDKMAKSADNFLRLQTVIDKGIHPLAYRYFLLQAHYRSPIEFSWEALEASQEALERILRSIFSMKEGIRTGGEENIDHYKEIFKELISQDLDTPKAVALLHTVLDSNASNKDILEIVYDFDKVLGLNLKNLSERLTEIPKEHIDLQEESDRLRKNKQFEEADKIRDTLVKMGYEIKDFPNRRYINKTLKTLTKEISKL